jgi:hypothetical protein
VQITPPFTLLDYDFVNEASCATIQSVTVLKPTYIEAAGLVESPWRQITYPTHVFSTLPERSSAGVWQMSSIRISSLWFRLLPFFNTVIFLFLSEDLSIVSLNTFRYTASVQSPYRSTAWRCATLLQIRQILVCVVSYGDVTRAAVASQERARLPLQKSLIRISARRPAIMTAKFRGPLIHRTSKSMAEQSGVPVTTLVWELRCSNLGCANVYVERGVLWRSLVSPEEFQNEPHPPSSKSIPTHNTRIWTPSSFWGALGSVVGWDTMLQTGSSRVRFPIRSLDFLIDLILPAALWPRGRLSL